MENKTTVELITEFEKLSSENDPNGARYLELMDELKTRDPFVAIFDEAWEGSLAAHEQDIKQLQADIKVLKRHQHDPNNGDVLARV